MVFADKPFLNPNHPPAPKFKSLKQVVNIEKNQKDPIDAPTCEYNALAADREIG